MPEIINTVDINASPDVVWAVLGDLTATADWLPGTVSARLDGATRVCDMADGSQVHEEISGYSAENRTFEWRHLKVPLPVRNSRGTFAVSAAGNGGSKVTLRTEFEALDDATAVDVTAMIDGAFQQSLASLRRRVETGARWNSA